MMTTTTFTVPETNPASVEASIQPTVANQAATALSESTTTPATVSQNVAEIVSRLATLKAIDYDRVRKEEAKALNIQVKTLDDMVKAERNQDSVSRRMPFPEVLSWPEAVNPAFLLNEISAIIQSLVVLDEHQAVAGALWTAHTYFIAEVDTSPLAIITAPEKACAKTIFQTVLGRMAYRPLPASNASLSALFRAIESWKPTLFIDEADTFFRDNAELHGMVNAGYKRGGYVLRSESTGDTFEPRMFSVYGAKSIAGIALEKHLPDSTMSRGIVFNLRRKLPDEKVERLRTADAALFERIASKLTRFAEDYSQQLRLTRPVLPESLSDREQDNWEPLLAIASCAGPEWVERATKAALELSKSTKKSVSTGNEMLADIQTIFEQKGIFKIRTVDLIEALVAVEEGAWATYNWGRPLSPRQLSNQLSAYGIRPKTVRMPDGSTPKGYDAGQFADAFARYLGAPEELLQQRNAATPLTSVPTPTAGIGYTTQQDDPGGLDAFLAALESMPVNDAADVQTNQSGAVADTPCNTASTDNESIED